MRFLTNLSVRGKMAFAFGCVLVLMMALGGFAVRQMGNIAGQTDAVLTGNIPGIRESLHMSDEHTLYRQREIRLQLTAPKDVSRLFAKMDGSLAAYETARKKYEAAIGDDTERGLYNEAMTLSKAYFAGAAKVVALYNAGDFDAAKAMAMSPEELKLFDDAHAAFEKLSDYNDQQAAAAGVAASGIYRSSLIGVCAAVAVALIAAIGLGLAISSAIATPLKAAVVVAEAVAEGDLTQSLESSSKDEVGQLTRALGNMVTKLRAVVTEVRGGVDSVGTASAQIASGNIDLSQRTEEQASNLQQTAASMEELTATVQQNSESARAAAQIAASATDAAERGGKVVGEVVTTMRSISDSSKRIADIIGVIDGIAFQTNILALNASVEAARAGEQGRGFSVVATEVRSLAQRSAQAAKEIKSLIQQSVARVDDGSQQVAEAGDAMADIVSQVKRAHDLVSEISAASAEQSQGIAQVGDAIAQLDQVTQQNAALVEESAAAAESMSAQAVKLSASVSHFNVGGGTDVAAARPVAKPFKAAPAKVASALSNAKPGVRISPTAKQPVSTKPAAAPVAAPKASVPELATATASDDDWAAF